MIGRQEPAQTARRQHAERVDRDLRAGSRAAEPEIGREQALRAAEGRADHRDLAEQRIHRIGRRDGAVQLYPVAPGIDPAGRGNADRLAVSQGFSIDRTPSR